MSDPIRDVTPLPDLLHGRSRAGPVRERRPVYVDLLPPCNAGCPAGENIQAWLSHTQAGRHEQAWRQLVADNPLPAIHGRVCYHPCESVCNRASLDSAVSIHSVERFLGDLALEQGWQFDPSQVRSGRRVLVVGAGPCGLSAAYHLGRLGHEVEIRDSGEQTGGMMRYGIPAYRLPRDVLTGELDRIAAMGVRVTCGHKVEDLVAEREEGAFDAVFVAVGAHLSRRRAQATSLGRPRATAAPENLGPSALVPAAARSTSGLHRISWRLIPGCGSQKSFSAVSACVQVAGRQSVPWLLRFRFPSERTRASRGLRRCSRSSSQSSTRRRSSSRRSGGCTSTSRSFPFPTRITIADNASTDGTWRIACALAAELDGVACVRLDQKGRGRALHHVWSASDAAVLAYMDVDLSTDLAALLPLVAPLVSGHSDLAIGTRLARGANVVRGPKREVISRAYNRILHTALGTRFSDAQCGFKAIRADRARLLLPLVKDRGWFFDTELLVLAERAGFRIHEVPVDWVDDPDSPCRHRLDRAG